MNLSRDQEKSNCIYWTDNCYTAEFFDKNLIGEFEVTPTYRFPARSRATCIAGIVEAEHRFNMELDPRKFVSASVYIYPPTPQLPSPFLPHLGLLFEVLVNQDRRHLFVTPCSRARNCCNCLTVRGSEDIGENGPGGVVGGGGRRAAAFQRSDHEGRQEVG